MNKKVSLYNRLMAKFARDKNKGLPMKTTVIFVALLFATSKLIVARDL